jgi:hypothetical protein
MVTTNNKANGIINGPPLATKSINEIFVSVIAAAGVFIPVGTMFDNESVFSANSTTAELACKMKCNIPNLLFTNLVFKDLQVDVYSFAFKQVYVDYSV